MKRGKKSLGQNFLFDKNIALKITSKASIKKNTVIEIGPGYGFLTDLIIEKKPKKLVLIEKDNEIYNYLKEKYRNHKNIKIINEDVINFDFKKFKKVIVISNIPYNISKKLMLKLFKSKNNILEIILMIQKEFSLKIDYNIEKLNKYKFISAKCSEYQRLFDVSKTVFFPQPKVQSTVVKFIPNKEKINWLKINKFIEIIFNNKRKKISSKLNGIKYSKIKLLLNKRIDEIKLDDLLKIYNIF